MKPFVFGLFPFIPTPSIVANGQHEVQLNHSMTWAKSEAVAALLSASLLSPFVPVTNAAASPDPKWHCRLHRYHRGCRRCRQRLISATVPCQLSVFWLPGPRKYGDSWGQMSMQVVSSFVSLTGHTDICMFSSIRIPLWRNRSLRFK